MSKCSPNWLLYELYASFLSKWTATPFFSDWHTKACVLTGCKQFVSSEAACLELCDDDHQRMLLILLVSCPQLLSQSADVSCLYSMYPMYPMYPKVGHLQGQDSVLAGGGDIRLHVPEGESPSYRLLLQQRAPRLQHFSSCTNCSYQAIS